MVVKQYEKLYEVNQQLPRDKGRLTQIIIMLLLCPFIVRATLRLITYQLSLLRQIIAIVHNDALIGRGQRCSSITIIDDAVIVVVIAQRWR